MPSLKLYPESNPGISPKIEANLGDSSSPAYDFPPSTWHVSVELAIDECHALWWGITKKKYGWWMNESIWPNLKKITNLDLREIKGVPIALTFHHQLGAQVTRVFGRYNLSLPTVTASEPGHPWWKCWGNRVSTTVPPKSRWFLRWPKKKRSQIEINCQVCQPLRVWNRNKATVGLALCDGVSKAISILTGT